MDQFTILHSKCNLRNQYCILCNDNEGQNKTLKHFNGIVGWEVPVNAFSIIHKYVGSIKLQEGICFFHCTFLMASPTS